jgi:ACS family tartrate transporter-like MFS transporter
MVASGIGLMMLGGASTVLAVVIAASTMSLGNAAQPPLFSSVGAASRGTVNAVGIAFVNSLSGLGGFLGPAIWGFVLEQSGSLWVGTALSGGMVMLAAPLALLARERVGPAPAVARPAAV